MRFRFSILSGLSLTAIAAVAIAAVKYNSDFWVLVTFLLCVGCNLLSMLATLLADRSKRAPFLGFAIFGWGTFLILFRSFLNYGVGHEMPSIVPPPFVSTYDPEGDDSPEMVRRLAATRRDQIRVSLACLLYGSGGAIVGGIIDKRLRRRTEA